MNDSEKDRLFDAMNDIDVGYILAALAAKKEMDPIVGIYVAKIEIEPIRIKDLWYEFFAAEINTFVKPHFHKIGDEPYLIVRGDSEMNTGHPDAAGLVTWRSPVRLSKDGRFIVRGTDVHSLRNVGTDPLILLFACPDAHLVDAPKGDRHMIDQLPRHYAT